MIARIHTALDNRNNDTGASAVEYALLVVAIALIMVFGAFALGGKINERFNESATCVDTATVGTVSC